MGGHRRHRGNKRGCPRSGDDETCVSEQLTDFRQCLIEKIVSQS